MLTIRTSVDIRHAAATGHYCASALATAYDCTTDDAESVATAAGITLPSAKQAAQNRVTYWDDCLSAQRAKPRRFSHRYIERTERELAAAEQHLAEVSAV